MSEGKSLRVMISPLEEKDQLVEKKKVVERDLAQG
jgi:hypothetical protein